MNKQVAHGRNAYYDIIKGMLIVLVIIGHFLPGTLSDNYLRYIIYSFHMPVFFMLSGYLFNCDKAMHMNALTRMKYYLVRFVPSWICATSVYYLLRRFLDGQNITIYDYIRSFIYPWYHLWYVIGFLFCVFTVIVYLNINHGALKNNVQFFPLFVFSLFLFLMDEIDIATIAGDGTIGKCLSLVDYSVRPQFLLCFTIGMIIKEKEKCVRIKNVYLTFSAIILLTLTSTGFFFQGISMICQISGFLFALCLFLIIIRNRNSRWTDIKIASLARYFGENSFAIYLWHVIGKEIGLALTGNQYNIIYYGICLAWIALLCAGINFHKNKRIHKTIATS